MTKKDYILIAEAIHDTVRINNKDSNSAYKAYGLSLIKLTVEHLAIRIRAQDLRFNYERFRKACGVDSDDR
jgi:hypothetical protein